MPRYLKAIACVCIIFTLTACGPKEQKPAPTRGIKITDLAPATSDNSDRYLKTMNFDIFTFEIPAENASMFQELWSMLYTKPIHFANETAFRANSFKLAFGEIQMWKMVGQHLDSAQALQRERARFLLTAEGSQDLLIKRITGQADIFYLNKALSLKSLTAERGHLALRINADKIPGARGVCTLSAKPIFVPKIPGKSEQLIFEELGFASKMTRGDFLLLGPKHNINQPNSLNNYFFTKTGLQPKFLIYAIFCLGIID